MDIRMKLYSEMVTKITRGNSRGQHSNAKPIFLISLIDFIPFVQKNEFYLQNSTLAEIYKTNLDYFDKGCKTPMLLPYYFLGSESFYELIWKSDDVPPLKSHTPSGKYLRENLVLHRFPIPIRKMALNQDENRD